MFSLLCKAHLPPTWTKEPHESNLIDIDQRRAYLLLGNQVIKSYFKLVWYTLKVSLLCQTSIICSMTATSQNEKIKMLFNAHCKLILLYQFSFLDEKIYPRHAKTIENLIANKSSSRHSIFFPGHFWIFLCPSFDSQAGDCCAFCCPAHQKLGKRCSCIHHFD